MPQFNKKGLELVKHFEGCYLKAYQDSVGVWTLGYGRIRYPSGGRVMRGDTCSQAQADAWLMEDLEAEGGKYVRLYLNGEDKLSDDEYSALVSFTFNRGAGRFREYVAPWLNRDDKKGAMKSLCSVNWAGLKERKYLLGLDRRRWAERRLFEGGNWRDFDTVPKFKAFKERGYRA